VLGYLAERGIAREQLDRVRVPAGLDLGKTTHVEIAVAILAELVQLRAAGQLGAPARGDLVTAAKRRTGAAGARPAKSRAARPAEQPAEAIDPVCGMTVQAGPEGRPLEYEGVTYYFCCAGCRSEFESKPASYARKETRC
jgi:xanthine dehydrogenase accessory factor